MEHVPTLCWVLNLPPLGPASGAPRLMPPQEFPVHPLSLLTFVFLFFSHSSLWRTAGETQPSNWELQPRGTYSRLPDDRQHALNIKCAICQVNCVISVNKSDDRGETQWQRLSLQWYCGNLWCCEKFPFQGNDFSLSLLWLFTQLLLQTQSFSCVCFEETLASTHFGKQFSRFFF